MYVSTEDVQESNLKKIYFSKCSSLLLQYLEGYVFQSVVKIMPHTISNLLYNVILLEVFKDEQISKTFIRFFAHFSQLFREIRDSKCS